MMIKEGQIYSHTHIGKNIVICITRVRKNGNPYIITNNGTSGTRDSDDFEKYTLIAEYPTWQQAVNSKEFKNIDCGKAGYKTLREIELEKKLEIAVKALKEYANRKRWKDIEFYDEYYFSAFFEMCGYELAEKTLKKIGG